MVISYHLWMLEPFFAIAFLRVKQANARHNQASVRSSLRALKQKIYVLYEPLQTQASKAAAVQEQSRMSCTLIHTFGPFCRGHI